MFDDTEEDRTLEFFATGCWIAILLMITREGMKGG